MAGLVIAASVGEHDAVQTRWREATMWVPPVGTALAAALAYELSRSAEEGSRAGAEPVVAGVLAAAPFVPLLFWQVACAAYAGRRTGRARTAAVVATTGAALLGAAMVVAVLVLHDARGYAWTTLGAEAAALIGLLLLPTLPAWAAGSAQPAPSSSESRR